MVRVAHENEQAALRQKHDLDMDEYNTKKGKKGV